MRSGSHVQLATLRNRDLELQRTSPFSNHGSVERSTACCLAIKFCWISSIFVAPFKSSRVYFFIFLFFCVCQFVYWRVVLEGIQLPKGIFWIHPLYKHVIILVALNILRYISKFYRKLSFLCTYCPFEMWYRPLYTKRLLLVHSVSPIKFAVSHVAMPRDAKLYSVPFLLSFVMSFCDGVSWILFTVLSI
jgi:hypothetical protein